MNRLPNHFTDTIDSFIFQANSLLEQFQQLQLRIKNFRNDPVRDFLSELGGAIGRDLFESQAGRSLGKAFVEGYLQSQEAQYISQEAQRLNTSLSILLAGIRAFLSSVSVPKPNLKPSGNSSILLRRLRRADEAMRYDTKLRRIVSLLRSIREEPLIYNSSIQQWKEQTERREIEEGAPYKKMKQLETSLRSFIASKLAEISSNWWVERVPEDVRRLAEERKSRNEHLYPWQSDQEVHPIHYVDFPDYVKIILRRDNWEKVFSSTFGDREIISAKLRELGPIRNSIAHYRPLTPKQEDKLELYASEIIGAVRPAQAHSESRRAVRG
jgi:hypothetical protein